jgi:hypothetical protein
MRALFKKCPNYVNNQAMGENSPILVTPTKTPAKWHLVNVCLYIKKSKPYRKKTIVARHSGNASSSATEDQGSNPASAKSFWQKTKQGRVV